MDHRDITDIDLLEYLAGRLPPDRRAAVEARAAGSESVRRRLDELRGTWDALGRWEVDASDRDLLPGVLARVERERTLVVRLPSRWRAVARVAAMWLVAVAVGVGAGRYVVSQRRPTEQDGATAAVEDEDVVQALYLDAIGSGDALGLVQSVTENGTSADEEVDQ